MFVTEGTGNEEIGTLLCLQIVCKFKALLKNKIYFF